MRSFSARDRRALRFLASAVALYTMVQFVARPALNYRRALQEQVEATQDALGRERDLLTRARHFPAERQQLDRARLASASRIFREANAALAAASFAGYVRAQAGASRLMVISEEPLPATDVPSGLTELSMTLQVVGNIDQTLRWIQRLSTGPRLVWVETLTLAADELSEDGTLSTTIGLKAYAAPAARGPSKT